MENIPSTKELGLLVLFAILVPLVQRTSLLSFYGVKPNLTLVFLIALALFFGNGLLYGAIACFMAAFLIVYGVTFEAALAMAVMGGAMFFLKHALPGRIGVNAVGAAMVAGPLFYLMTEPTFLIENPSTLLIEVLYNGLMGAGASVLLAALCTPLHAPRLRTYL